MGTKQSQAVPPRQRGADQENESNTEQQNAQCDEGSRFIGEPQTLARVSISRRTLYAWRKQGWIPYIRLGRRILYHWPSVQAALLRQQRGPQ
jgi:hypothetical protein